MNKYEELFKKNELKHNDYSSLRNEMLCKEFYRFILKTNGKETCLELYKKYKYNIVLEYILVFSLINKEYRKWILYNVFSNINKESLLSLFINILTDSYVMNEKELCNTLMKSMKMLSLVKKITYNDKMFILITNDNETIRFKNSCDSVEELEMNKNKCHTIVYELIKRECDKNKNDRCKIATILEKNLFNGTRYNSIIVFGNYINDFARNIVISLEDYKKLFKPEFILCNSAKDVIKSIDILEENNLEFKEANLCKVLKYAIHKQNHI